jgi:Ni/Co efflux regulator RcnB
MSLMKRLFALVVISSFSVGVAGAANCRQQIENAERKLHQAERRHGEHSRQANNAREHLERVRANCHERHHDRDHDRH